MELSYSKNSKELVNIYNLKPWIQKRIKLINFSVYDSFAKMSLCNPRATIIEPKELL